MKEPEMELIGNMIARIVKERDAAVPAVKQQVLDLCKKFPLYE
jgi:glycine/serine hydroxymethyltransferase